MKLSPNLDLVEVTRSESAKRKGISNNPTPEHLENLKRLAEKVFQPIREHFATPINISSGYRSKALNAAVGGSTTSDHCYGRAIDIDMDGSSSEVNNNDIFHWIKDNLEFKQLIAEFPDANGKLGWVHVAYGDGLNKGEILIAVKKGTRTMYIPYKGNERRVCES
jgi:zinc D-Ala-D-Ala carboxypeptidase